VHFPSFPASLPVDSEELTDMNLIQEPNANFQKSNGHPHIVKIFVYGYII
jgi:hypothetical protein